MTGICETCRWWDTSISQHDAPDTTGVCRRWPPGFDDRTGKAVWPFTEDIDWCGECRPVDDDGSEP